MAPRNRGKIASLYARYGAMVHRRAYILLGNDADAEDATQEVFTRLVNSLHQHRGEASLTTWLYPITTNHCLNVLRNHNRRQRLLTTYQQDIEPAACTPTTQELVVTRQLLANADEQQASAAVYLLVDGMTRAEAAHALGVSERTVYNLLRRFIEWAKASLEDDSPPCRKRSAQVSSWAGVSNDR